MSFGEIISLYDEGELIITPEYQRAFRWKDEQKTDFIESILLGIPVPPVFVAEDEEGKWELVDGLQRISTILSFFGDLKQNEAKNNLRLKSGSIIKELDGVTKDSIPKKLSNTIRRSICRVEILRWDGSIDMRYELFSRLNTTSSPLTHQEIRNCIFRSHGNDFNLLLKEIASNEDFEKISDLSDRHKIEMFGEELILRFFCLQHDYNITGTLHQHLTEFMRNVIEKKISFDLKENKEIFMTILKRVKKEYFKESSHFSHKLWDAVLYLFSKQENVSKEQIRQLKKQIKEANINRGVNHKDRPKAAIGIAKKFIT